MTKCLALVVLMLTACAGVQTRAQKIDTACASAIAAMRTITIGVEQGKVSAEQQAQAVQAGEAIAPICSASERPSMDAIKQAAFNAAIARVLAIAGAAQ